MTHLHDKELDKEFDEKFVYKEGHFVSVIKEAEELSLELGNGVRGLTEKMNQRRLEIKSFINTHYISKKVVEEFTERVEELFNEYHGKKELAPPPLLTMLLDLQALTKKEDD